MSNPTSYTEFRKRVQEARWRVDEFDEETGEQDREIETIYFALMNGLIYPDGGEQYDALVMLGDLLQKKVDQCN